MPQPAVDTPPPVLDPAAFPLAPYLAAGGVTGVALGWFFGPMFLINTLLAFWVARDARERESSTPFLWAGGVLLAGLIAYPLYHASRHLKEDEARVGGTGWNMVKPFLVLWTVTLLINAVRFYLDARALIAAAPPEEENLSQAMVHASASAGSLAGLWFFVSFLALVVGYKTRKSYLVERGPTGPMARKRAVRIMREQNAELARQKEERERQEREEEGGS